jgi:flagellar basal-body rod protein FlgB
MPDKLSFSKTFNALENAINVTQRRNNVIAGNISNADTPDYRAKDIDFKTALTQSLKSNHQINLVRTNPGHIGQRMSAGKNVESFEENGEWNGYNWVNLDREMTKLTQNNLIYRASVETLLRKIAILKEVIREGGR